MLNAIKNGLARPGRTRAGLAHALGVPNSAITALLKGKRAIKLDELPTIIEYLGLDQVPIVGRVSHGGAIEPVIVPGNHDNVQLPQGSLPCDAHMQAYEVAGDSMMPRYDAGDVVLVIVEQKYKLADYIGTEQVVRCQDGKVWLRYLERGSQPHIATLTSFNARAVTARVDWVGEIYMTLRHHQRRKRPPRQRR